jgi:hypothetical protein
MYAHVYYLALGRGDIDGFLVCFVCLQVLRLYKNYVGDGEAELCSLSCIVPCYAFDSTS